MRLIHLFALVLLLSCVSVSRAQEETKSEQAEKPSEQTNDDQPDTKVATAAAKDKTAIEPTKPDSTIAPVKAQPSKTTTRPRRPRRKIMLELPLLGAPKTRISAGTRSPEDDADVAPTVTVLAPTRVGVTTHAAPTLFWHLSHPTNHNVIVAVINTRTLKNVVRVVIPGKHEAGIHGLDLAKHHVALEPDVDYRWLVTIVSGSRPTSKDAYSSALLRRVALSETDARAIATATGEDRLYVVARLGHWYDVLASIHEQIAADPTDLSLREIRAQLLDAAELTDIAAAERGGIRTPER